MPELAFKSIRIKSKIIKGLEVELHWDCFEGVSGEYDSDDPQDEPLLRFDVIYKGEQIEDGSYCTNLRVDDDRKLLTKAVEALVSEAERCKTGDSEYNHGFHFKKVGEYMSWIRIENGKLI